MFPGDFDDIDPKANLLSTIRVPKNLLYLTDRLPKPAYSSQERKRRQQEEYLRRRTYEGSASQPYYSKDSLPDSSSNPGSHHKLDHRSSLHLEEGSAFDQSDAQSLNPKKHPLKKPTQKASLLAKDHRPQLEQKSAVNYQDQKDRVNVKRMKRQLPDNQSDTQSVPQLGSNDSRSRVAPSPIKHSP